MKIALIGAGRMGGALASGWVRGGFPATDLMVFDPSPGPIAAQIAKKGGKVYSDLHADLFNADIAVFAIKPQILNAVGPLYAEKLPGHCLILSILAGTTLAGLEAIFAPRPIIRAMPNTPAQIGQGISAFVTGEKASEEHAAMAQKLLSPGGGVLRLEDETQMDIVTAVSGSGPAYVFHLVEALEAAAIAAGMPEDLSAALARQTVIGSGALLAASSDSAAALRQSVTSPGGTTEAALEVLMGEKGLTVLVERAVAAAVKRGQDLGR